MKKAEIYKKILGVHGEVDQETLKRLYRKRAKYLHPDRNPNPKSHDHFVLLQEAYSYFEKKLSEGAGPDINAIFNKRKYPESYRKEKWKFEERMAARKKAAERKKYKEEYYRNKGYYRRLERLFLYFDMLRFVTALFVLFGLPVVGFMLEGFVGLIIAIFVQAITYPLWTKAIKRFVAIH